MAAGRVDMARARARQLTGETHVGDRDNPFRAKSASVPPADHTDLPRAVCLLDAPDEAPPTWLVPDLIPKGEPVLIAGEGGTMKTTLALHLACAVAAGGPLFNQGPVLAAGPVLVVTGEDPRGVVANRCEAIARGHGWPRDRVLAHLHVLALGGTNLVDPAWRAHLVAEVVRTGAALVILDPLANLASGDENSNTERRPVVETWRALAQGGATPVLVHHAGKAGDGTRSKRDRIRGGTAIPDGSRCTLFLEPAPGGVRVENVKQSRAMAHPPFVVVADVTTDPANSALWTAARFTRTTQRRAAMTEAARVLVELIAERPGLTGNALREAAKIGRDALFDGLRELENAGRIRAEPGPRGARFWHLTDPAASDPDWSGTSPDCTPATGPDWSPLEGGGPVAGPERAAGSDDDEAAYLADERAALEDLGA